MTSRLSELLRWCNYRAGLSYQEYTEAEILIYNNPQISSQDCVECVTRHQRNPSRGIAKAIFDTLLCQTHSMRGIYLVGSHPNLRKD